MKPAAVINQGDNFVTLRATTENPAEIWDALTARDVQHVYKGDQNQTWDAVLANHCLSRALGSSDAEITFFVQDERLGTSDVRLARVWRARKRRYVLTEDYYRGRAGAVWEHQDASHGLFFTEAVSPAQFKEAGIHLHQAAAQWEKRHAAAMRDQGWVDALAMLGIAFPTPDGVTADRATRLGPAVAPDLLAEAFADVPEAALFYAFTKTDGLYGIVPVQNDNATLSSIPALDPEISGGAAWILVKAAARGAMRLAGTAAHRRGVKRRVRRVAEWAREWASQHPDGSVTDFQVDFGKWLTHEIFPADKLELDRASRFTGLDAADLDHLRTPEDTLHFFLDLSLRHPREFSDAYNDALNRVGFGLQRMRYEEATGEFTPPFFVEWAPGGPGTPVYRYGLELSGTDRSTISMINKAVGDQEITAEGRITSARDLLQTLLDKLPHAEGLAIIGKAAAFAAELQRTPRGLGLPRQGSKYAPMVDHLVGGLRARGVLTQPTGLLIRIGLNVLDRFDAMGDMTLRLPRFLDGPLGKTITCRDFAARWRGTAARAHGFLELLGHCEVGQHVHLARIITQNARRGSLQELAAREPHVAKLLQSLRVVEDADALLGEMGRNFPIEAVECLERLVNRRCDLLARRRAVVDEARAAHAGGRLVPDPERLAAIQGERETVECQILLIIAAYVRRLWQRAESLPYINDRPYTLALYLLFGSDIFGPICRQVEFDVEYVSPTVEHTPVAEEYHVAHPAPPALT